MPRGHAGSDHHDEPEAAGGEGSPGVGERLSREPEGGARDPSSARKDGPHADAPMGAAGGNPANPARNHAGGEAALDWGQQARGAKGPFSEVGMHLEPRLARP